jgi:DNA repair exonuclease SbcCD ATPase subunit
MRDPITPELLAELRRLEKAATPGPWTDEESRVHVPKGDVATCDDVNHIADSEANAALIAAARNALPALLDHIETLTAELDIVTAQAVFHKQAAEAADGQLVQLRAELARVMAELRAKCQLVLSKTWWDGGYFLCALGEKLEALLKTDVPALLDLIETLTAERDGLGQKWGVDLVAMAKERNEWAERAEKAEAELAAAIDASTEAEMKLAHRADELTAELAAERSRIAELETERDLMRSTYHCPACDGTGVDPVLADGQCRTCGGSGDKAGAKIAQVREALEKTSEALMFVLGGAMVCPDVEERVAICRRALAAAQEPPPIHSPATVAVASAVRAGDVSGGDGEVEA